MRFQREVVHPVIFAASDRVAQSVWTTGGFQGTPEQTKAYNEHQSVWYKEYGKGLALYFVAAIASFVISTLIYRAAGKPFDFGILAGLLATFWVGVGIVGYRRNLRALTAEELGALAPAMDLTDIQRVYVDALIALAELRYPKDQFQEIVGQLNRLLDEEGRLLQLKGRGMGNPASQEEIRVERARISERLAATEDPITAEALQRSLEICENRLKAAHELSFVDERVEAQLEMVSQAIRGIRDTLLRLKSAPSVSSRSLDMDALRQTVDHAHRHSVALEQAVDEVRTLG